MFNFFKKKQVDSKPMKEKRKCVCLDGFFDCSFDLLKLPEERKADIRVGCENILKNGVLAQVIAHRANKIKEDMTLLAKDFHEVEINRYRLLELRSLMLDLARLSKKEKKEETIIEDKTHVF